MKLCNHTKHTSSLEDPVVLNVQHFDETEAITSQAGEVTQFAECPWRFLTSILSELKKHKKKYFLNLCITGTSFFVQEYSHLSQLFNLALCFTPLCILRVSFLGDVLSHEWHTNIVPPALWDSYLSTLSEYPFWYIHACISHIYSVFSFTSVSSVWVLFIFFRTFIFTLITLELLIYIFLLMVFFYIEAYVFLNFSF